MSRYTKYRLQFDDEKDFNDYDLRILANQDSSSTLYSNPFSSSTGWTLGDGFTIASGQLQYFYPNPLVNTASIDLSSTLRAGDKFLKLDVVSASSTFYVGVKLYDSDDNLVASVTDTAVSGSKVITSDLYLTESLTGARLDIECSGTTGNVLFDIIRIADWGGSTSLQGTGDPIILMYDTANDGVLDPIKASSLDISFYQMNDSDDYTELFIPTKQQFKVDLYKNDSIFWTGWLSDDLVSIPDISAPIAIKLKAYDGIHLLKTTNYFDTPLNDFRDSSITTDNFDYTELYKIIGKALYGTGNADEIQMYARLNNSLTSNAQFFEKAYMYHGSFIEKQESISSHAVLYNVLESLKCICYQRDGYWCIVKPSDFTYSTGSVVSRKFSGGSNSNTSFSTITGDANKLTSTVTFNKVDRAAVLTFSPANKQITVTHNTDYNFNPTRFAYDEVIDTSSNGFEQWISGDNEASGTSFAEEIVVVNSLSAAQQAEAPSDEVIGTFIELKCDTSQNPFDTNFNDCGFLTNDSNITLVDDIVPIAGSNLNFFDLSLVGSMKVRVIDSNFGSRTVWKLGLFVKVINSVSGVGKDGDLFCSTGGLDVLAETDNTGGIVARTNTSPPTKYEITENGIWTEVGVEFSSNDPFVRGLIENSDGTFSQRELYTYYCGIIGDPENTEPIIRDDNETGYYGNYSALSELKLRPVFDGMAAESSQYIINNASGDYIYNESIEVPYGSNIISDGAGFIFFKDGSNNQVASYNDFSDDTFDDLPLQSFAGLAHMLLTHKPYRKLEGTHYGDYKFGDIISYDSGITNTTGKFYPITVSMNLRRARVDFNGDELLDNSSITSSYFTNQVKFIGKNDTSLKYSL